MRITSLHLKSISIDKTHHRSNRLRGLHHHIIRAFPLKPHGFAVVKKLLDGGSDYLVLLVSCLGAFACIARHVVIVVQHEVRPERLVMQRHGLQCVLIHRKQNRLQHHQIYLIHKYAKLKH